MFRSRTTFAGDQIEAATQGTAAGAALISRLAALCLVLPALALAGCGGEEAGEASGNGQLVIDQQWDLLTADPARDSSTTGRYVMNAVYDTLTKFKPELVDGEWTVDLSDPEPWLAESFSVDDSGRVWTFQIREGVVFSDGTPLTAEDVVFSLQRLQNIQAGAAPTLTETFESIEAVDDHTVEITTTVPNPAVPHLLTHNGAGIVNSTVARENGASNAEDAAETDNAQSFFDQNSLGSGPYMYQSFSTTGETVLVRNPRFWGEEPYYERLVFRNVTPEVARQNVRSGRADIAIGLTADQVSDMPESVTVHTGPSATFFYIQANVKESVSPLAANPNLWEAIRYGMDYEKLLRLAGEGAIQMCGLVPTTFNGALDQGECVSRDVERARAALARAVQETGVSDPTLTIEWPTDFSLEGVSFGTLAEAVEQDLAEIGLNLELRGAPLETWLPRWQEALPELVETGQASIFPHENATAAFLPTGYRGQYAGYTPTDAPALTELGVQAMETIDAAERASLFQDLQRRLNTETPLIPQFQAATIIAASEPVKGVVTIPALITDPTVFYEEG